MPVLDEATCCRRKAGSVTANGSISMGSSIKVPNGVAKPPTAAPLVDLLDLGDDVPVPNSSGNDFLQDLLGVDILSSSVQPGK